MKLLASIFILFLFNSSAASQTNKVDSLVSILNNSQIMVDGNYLGATFMLTGPAVELSHIGKSATEKLLTVLEDSVKGVIAHRILTNLWSLPISWKLPIFIERENVLIFQYNELNFYIKGKSVFANKRDLQLRSILWKNYISKQSRS